MEQNVTRYISIVLQTLSFLAFIVMLIFYNEIAALAALTGGILLWLIFLILSETEIDKRNLGFIWIAYGFIISFVLLFTYAISEDMWGAILWNVDVLGLVLFVLLISLTVGLVTFYIQKQDISLAQTHESIRKLLAELKNERKEEPEEIEI